MEVRNSLRLGVLLAALVAINVYVFFFNRKTAPREVLNLQSTSKALDGNRREILDHDDLKKAAAAGAKPAPAFPAPPVRLVPAPLAAASASGPTPGRTIPVS